MRLCFINIIPKIWNNEKDSFKNKIAHKELKMGIKCKKTPALFAPINETPLFQKRKANIPANIATYEIISKSESLLGKKP